QFYLFWPVLIMSVVWLASRLTLRREVLLTCAMGGVAVVSLFWAIHLTDLAQARAYLVTTTRLWELAAGGLVALAVSVGTRATRQDPGPVEHRPASRWLPTRTTLAWLGLAAILTAAGTFD